jgi:hypothetical protein
VWDLDPSNSWNGVAPRPALRDNAGPPLKAWLGRLGLQGTTSIIRGYEGEVNNFRRPVENIGAPGRASAKFPGWMLFPGEEVLDAPPVNGRAGQGVNISLKLVPEQRQEQGISVQVEIWSEWL